MIKFFLSVCALLMLLTGCTEQKDLLLGRWQVVSVNRGGDVLGGPGFKGTVFEFTADGKVLTSSSMEENVVNYKRDGDYLIYESEGMQERYRIDSLSEIMLVIFSDADGIPTTTGMKRIDVKE